MGAMTTAMGTPAVHDLGDVLDVLRQWQRPGTPLQLHPGDLGWHWRLGADDTAAAVRTWSRDGEIVAVGLLDGPGLVRVGIAPEALGEEELARQVVTDIAEPGRVLPAGAADVELPPGALAHDLLGDAGWSIADPWALLCRELTDPVSDPRVRIESIGPEEVPAWAAVQRSAFRAEHLDLDVFVGRWHAMAQGPAYAAGRTLLAYDDSGRAVAGTIVWSAGPGRYGLIEPLGAHRDHHGHGYGKAITLAAAAALREMGASAAIVLTEGANTAGVAAYRSAGFDLVAERRDRSRAAS